MNEYILDKRAGTLNIVYNGFPYTFDLNKEEENTLGEVWLSFSDNSGVIRDVCLLDETITIYPLIKMKQKIGSNFNYSLETDFNNPEEIKNKVIIPN